MSIFALLDREPYIHGNEQMAALPWEVRRGSAELHRVSFRYPTRTSVPVLRDLSMQLLPGKTVALVGSSGSGKSTVLQLLERFYDPLTGESVDGENLRNANLSAVRSSMSLVSQEPNLFSCSIRENIAYGVNSQQVSLKEIQAAAQMANIHHFIEQLPQKYDTLLGSKGAQLSGGQKQRIAIARALLRNPKILLLDEATSALDPESELVVQEALNVAMRGRSCLIVAHRLSTVRNADVILVMQKGKLREQGTHETLMKSKGIYYSLVMRQAGGLMD